MKQFCLRGHDTFVVGRASSRGCMACRRMLDLKRNQAPKRILQQKICRHRNYTTKETVRAKRIADATAWNKAHPELRREYQRRYRLKYKGVNFWVEAAKESV